MTTVTALLALAGAPASAADPTPTTTASSTYYKNCSDAASQGVYNIAQSDPGYRSALDRDGDGIACES